MRPAGLDVEVVPAYHALTAEEAYTDGDGRLVGYLITIGDSVLYHAGDTVVAAGGSSRRSSRSGSTSRSSR